jgi:putative ABC transport system substrate-binding protein
MTASSKGLTVNGKNKRSKTMIRRIHVCLLLTVLLLTAFTAQAQQSSKVPRIGYLGGTSAAEVLRDGLREHGWTEGQNILVEYRFAGAKPEQLSQSAAELVRLKVDVIVAVSTPAAQAARRATNTVPIVFSMVSDPVASGLVASLARPGGNATGLSNMLPEQSGKLLELLKEAAPGVSRVAVVWDSANPGKVLELKEMQTVAPLLGITLQSLEVHNEKDIQNAFSVVSKNRSNGLVTFVDAVTVSHRQRIVDFAAKNRLPSIYQASDFVSAGGLMSYGTNRFDLHRRAATYVDKILKGTKPADLPVERPIKFDLVINLKTAKQIGLSIPPNVLARADRVIR